MWREKLPVEQLALWMHLNNVKLNGVKVISSIERGSALVATRELSDKDPILMIVPEELVLSLDNVWVYAKSDKHLLQVLEAAGEFARITHNATEGRIGVENPFSQYVKFLPEEFTIPTFWNDDERILLEGTSLEAALDSKLRSIEREFDYLRKSTQAIPWCRQHWWNAETGDFTLEDWKFVDAAYRSRALDLPGTGHATIPCVDMANHASGDGTTALYETDSERNAGLVLRTGKLVQVGEEVTITYGDDKGACEMLFSYGFIEEGMTSAKELFLDLDVADDDPLGAAKKVASKSPPGYRLFQRDGQIDWESPFVWLLCVNEEDGLAIKWAQTQEGERELHVGWKEQDFMDVTNFDQVLRKENNWDVFQLRAITTLQGRVREQLMRLKGNEERIQATQESGDILAEREGYAIELRDLEETLLLEAYEAFEGSKTSLLQSAVVQSYLGNAAADDGASGDDFA